MPGYLNRVLLLRVRNVSALFRCLTYFVKYGNMHVPFRLAHDTGIFVISRLQ